MDDDLEAIRAQRMTQMRLQNPSEAGQVPQAAGQGPNKKGAEEQRKQEQDMRNSILSSVLDQSARARLNTIALAKPEKAQMVENMIIQMATRGQLGGKLSEEQFVQILTSVSAQTKQETTVKFDRRRINIDDDDF